MIGLQDLSIQNRKLISHDYQCKDVEQSTISERKTFIIWTFFEVFWGESFENRPITEHFEENVHLMNIFDRQSRKPNEISRKF